MNDTIGGMMNAIMFWVRDEEKVKAKLQPFADEIDKLRAELEAANKRIADAPHAEDCQINRVSGQATLKVKARLFCNCWKSEDTDK